MLQDLNNIYADYARAQAATPEYRSGLEEEIRKSIGGNVATAGYQTAAAADSSSEFSPLVPEALDEIVGQVDFKAKHLEFFDWLPKQDVKQTVVTWMKTVENGNPWIERALSEGLISVNDAGVNARGSTRIKSYVETRELSDIQNAVPLVGGGAGVPSQALAFQTTKGMLSLHRALERDALFGSGYDGALNKLDGIQPQLIRAGQYENLDGSVVTMELLVDRLRTMQSAPYYADPTDIMVTPKVFTNLEKQQLAFGRRDMTAGAGVTYGFDEKGGLVVKAGNRSIPVRPITFQDNQADAPPAFASILQNTAINAVAPTAPTIGTGAGGAEGTISPGSNAGAGSKFAAGDVGTYKYSIIAYSDTGAYAVVASALSYTSVANELIQFQIKDSTSPVAASYYVIFRTFKGSAGTVLRDYHYLQTVAKNVGGLTTVTDANTVRSETGSVMFLRQDPEEIVNYQLIKLFRKPLAQTRMTQPFALFTACGLQVKVPEHQWLYTNVGY